MPGRLLHIFGLLIALPPQPAGADDIWPLAEPNALFFGATDAPLGTEAVAMGDVLWHIGGAHRLGFDIGVYGYNNGTISPHETHGAVTWTLPEGRLSLGVPVPAYDSFARAGIEAIVPVYGVDTAQRNRSEATSGAIDGSYLPWGLRYDGQHNQLGYAISGHWDKGSDVTILSFGGHIPLSERLSLSGSIEASDGGARDMAAKLQIMGVQDWGLWAVTLNHPGYVGVPDFIESFAAYRLDEQWTLMADLQMPLDGSAAILAIGEHYDISDRVGVTLGAVHDDTGNSVNLFLDRKF